LAKVKGSRANPRYHRCPDDTVQAMGRIMLLDILDGTLERLQDCLETGLYDGEHNAEITDVMAAMEALMSGLESSLSKLDTSQMDGDVH
jgi:hypothetical protein